MRVVCFLLFGVISVFAQPLSVGLKGGVPLSDFTETVSKPLETFRTSRRLIVGPSVELRLPAGLGVEFDILYRRFGVDLISNADNLATSVNTSGTSWEFPLLVKYRFGYGPIRPFVDAGVAWNRISDLSQSIQNVVRRATSDNPPELKNRVSTGFVLGAGLDLHPIFLHITPEIRYTRWGRENFSGANADALFRSNQNQAEFLVGITF